MTRPHFLRTTKFGISSCLFAAISFVILLLLGFFRFLGGERVHK